MKHKKLVEHETKHNDVNLVIIQNRNACEERNIGQCNQMTNTEFFKDEQKYTVPATSADLVKSIAASRKKEKTKPICAASNSIQDEIAAIKKARSSQPRKKKSMEILNPANILSMVKTNINNQKPNPKPLVLPKNFPRKLDSEIPMKVDFKRDVGPKKLTSQLDARPDVRPKKGKTPPPPPPKVKGFMDPYQKVRQIIHYNSSSDDDSSTKTETVDIETISQKIDEYPVKAEVKQSLLTILFMLAECEYPDCVLEQVVDSPQLKSLLQEQLTTEEIFFIKSCF